jgi:hypothetical protein
MSETALLDAPFPDISAMLDRANADVGAAIDRANASGKDFVADAQASVEKSIILGEELRKSWGALFVRPEAGTAERARALRGDFLQRLGQSLELMRSALDQASRAAPLAHEPLRGADVLADGVKALESIRREALAQWGLSEGMAQLAALPGVLLHLDQHGDLVRAQDVGLSGEDRADDPAVLARAAQENRVLLTNDERTMIAFARGQGGEGAATARRLRPAAGDRDRRRHRGCGDGGPGERPGRLGQRGPLAASLISSPSSPPCYRGAILLP